MIIMMIMAQENKDILLRDMCCRLPYGVMLKHISIEKPFKLFSIKRDEYASYIKDGVDLAANGIYYDWYVNDIYHDIELYIKPYLFPFSSMTEEQIKEFNSITQKCSTYIGKSILLTDFCNKHHIDWRGFIEKGLALDATGKNIY